MNSGHTRARSVYPRWRGEHEVITLVTERKYGLSPLARGTPMNVIKNADRGRFIPAGAGNTLSAHHAPVPYTVYPRWRGEHGFQRQTHREQVGLSPLARGTPYAPRVRAIAGRFIPAGAGNTELVAITFTKSAVYPRWRGEHETVLAIEFATRGLSPLARGTH